ncbi:MAG: TatD family hydrolase [Kiritimatiellae bacterium]|nr:TatD family hydrolase [Kiritimatiellia bacterium]
MFDAHAHLQDERLVCCRQAVLTAAAAAGVEAVCCCGSMPGDWDAVARLAVECVQPRLTPAFGVHPWYVGKLPPDWLDRLDACLAADPSAAVGEIGLDGVRGASQRDLQRAVLTAQLELAARRGRCVVLHGARAWGELCGVLAPYASRLPGFIAHSFGGSLEIMRDLVKWGGCISFSGTVCNPEATRVRAAAVQAPSDRLLVETDAPDLLPPGGVPAGSDAAGRLNQPANLVGVVASLAALRGVPAADIAALTSRNAGMVLGLTR